MFQHCQPDGNYKKKYTTKQNTIKHGHRNDRNYKRTTTGKISPN